MNRLFSFLVLLACFDIAAAQSPTAAASQALKLPDVVGSVAIWPLELRSGHLEEGELNAVNDFVEQALTRKAKEKQIKVITRRQLGNLLSELKLSTSEKTNFDKLAKSTGADAVVLPSGTLSKSGCLSVVINVVGTSGDIKGEIVSSAKPFKVNMQTEDIDFSGCD
jgi:curli biogenesis system outer membrane secretion channel CsgG